MYKHARGFYGAKPSKPGYPSKQLDKSKGPHIETEKPQHDTKKTRRTVHVRRSK
jgi:hypothetical protein